jgi:hypothetical protein
MTNATGDDNDVQCMQSTRINKKKDREQPKNVMSQV